EEARRGDPQQDRRRPPGQGQGGAGPRPRPEEGRVRGPEEAGAGQAGRLPRPEQEEGQGEDGPAAEAGPGEGHQGGAEPPEARDGALQRLVREEAEEAVPAEDRQGREASVVASTTSTDSLARRTTTPGSRSEMSPRRCTRGSRPIRARPRCRGWARCDSSPRS